MMYLAISILCSVVVGVLFKLARRYQINLFQTITWNYLFAVFFCYIFLIPTLPVIYLKHISVIHWSLGVLLPSIFVFLGLAIRHAGLARTDIAQRLSLIISLAAAYFIFSENFDNFKIIGIIFGFLAIILVMYRKSSEQVSFKNLIYLLFVFIGYGTVDILFKKISQQTHLPYSISLFIIYIVAFVGGILGLIYLYFIKKEKLQWVNFVCGGILGFFNFGNILFYLKAHQSMSDNPSIVFAAMNIGVILLGSLFGIVLFKETFTKWNYIGLFFALIAIILITISKIYAF